MALRLTLVAWRELNHRERTGKMPDTDRGCHAGPWVKEGHPLKPFNDILEWKDFLEGQCEQEEVNERTLRC